MSDWLAKISREYWEGWHCEDVTVSIGSTLGAVVTIPTFDMIAGRGPSAASAAGEALQGICEAQRVVIWAEGSTVDWDLELLGARFEGDGLIVMPGNPVISGVLSGQFMGEIFLPYVSFELTETGAVADVIVSVWFRLIGMGAGA